ncbi:MAG: type III pantothenate kinase [Bacteroidetes bacterium]|nr:type III pantothenate kinase [Bacteroidota bacterium]
MLLACDIGNSRIKAGLFSNNELVEFHSFQNAESFSSLFITKSIDQIAISSVVPKLTEKISTLLKNYSNSVPFIIDRNVEFNLRIDYDSIETLGIDRICSVEGAFYLYKNSNEYKNYNSNTFILSIDFGTATTINIIRYPGEFIGGAIAPGFRMMFDSLNTKTAQLPNVSEIDYKYLIGRDTISSIASGVINSNVGFIERTINYLESEMNATDFKVFITGGNAEKLIPHFNFDFTFVKELVLIGVKTVYDKNRI